MNTNQKYMLEAYMKPLYDGSPEGPLLESVRSLEQKLTEYADENPSSMDMVGDSGLRDEYNQIYMAVINRNNDYSTAGGDDSPKAFDYSKEQRLPTVHEYLDNYRLVYETSIKPNKRELTDKAYQELFNVENRTDDLMEAQIIIEKEHLIVNTVTAEYKYMAEDFLEAADPNYEVTSAGVKNSIGVYAGAKSLDEVTYMGELAKAVCDDIAVQTKLKLEMMVNFTVLVYGWEHSKRKIREGDILIGDYAKAMVVNREQMRKYYRFLSEDMGITFDIMKKTPFYRIMMLNPQGLDELWRIKKVMHYDNIRAIEYVLFEEMLSDKSIEEILMTPQPYPYYEMIDSNRYPEIDDEYAQLAEELNKDLKFFQRNRTPDGKTKKHTASQEELIDNTKAMTMNMAASSETGASGNTGAGKASGLFRNLSSAKTGVAGMSSDTKKSLAKGAAAGAAKDIGKGILRGLFRR